jgi:dihydroorotate dehydrogenase (fumarate)
MDLSVKYLGLKLKNPIVVGSSGLTNSIEKIKKLEQFGAGAIVLKSLFEEQILFEESNANANNEYDYPEAMDYIKAYARDNSIEKYLQLIRDAKKEVKIPIIASINCVDKGEWINFAKKMEDAGADALELNVSLLPSNINKTSADNEKMYFEIIEAINKAIKIPISLKMSHYSAGLTNLIQKLSWTKMISGFTLFNRYYNPDIDIENLKITSSGVFSSPEDISQSLRWVALLSEKIQVNIAASTGIHSGEDVIKQILVGADVVHIVSTLYKNGTEKLKEIIEFVDSWGNKHNYKSIDEFRGKLNFESAENSVAFERIQFMKYFGGIE